MRTETITMRDIARMRCTRCNRRHRTFGTDDGWNVEFRQGIFVAKICPDCQTPEENAEAAVKAATLDYRIDAFGQLVTFPKTVEV